MYPSLAGKIGHMCSIQHAPLAALFRGRQLNRNEQGTLLHFRMCWRHALV